nr:hypothetical protein CFP56_30405 [Quercus suber]
MSSGRSSAFFKHSDTSPDLPFGASLRDASKVTGSLELSTKVGFHIVALDCCFAFGTLANSNRSAFLLLSSCDSNLLGRWLLCELGNVRRFLASTDLCGNEVMISGCWKVLGIFLIKDFKVFILHFLSWFVTWLFPFVVKGKRLLMGVKELSCK